MFKSIADRHISFLLAAVALFAMMVVGMPPSYAGFNHLSEANAQTKQNIQQAMTELVTKQGFTPEAAAGVLGNVNQESGFDPALIERNKNRYKPIMDSDPCQMTRAENTGAIGYFQLDGSRRTDMFCWIHKQGKPWTDLPSQLHYALVEDIKIEDPFKRTAYMKRVTSWKYCTSAGIDCSNAPNKGLPGGIEDVKKMKDPQMVAVVWAAAWERCSDGPAGRLRLRATMAKEIFDAYGASAGTPGTSGTSSTATSGSDGGSEYAAIAANGKPVTEEDLEGMPKQPSWAEPNDLPEESKYENLSTLEQYNLNQIHSNIVDGQEYGPVRTAQVMIVMFGLGLILWSVLLLAGIVFDRTNVFFEFSMVRILSLGRMEYTHDATTVSKTRKQGKQIAMRSIAGMLLGLIIISGAVFGWLSMLLLFIHDRGLL